SGPNRKALPSPTFCRGSSPNSRRSPASCARPSKSSPAWTQPSPPPPTAPPRAAPEEPDMLNFAKVSAASEGALIRAYMTQDKPEPQTLKVHGVAIDGRNLETGERLTAYYTGRGERANWRPDLSPRVAAALGLSNVHAEPRDGELDALFEARRADNGADWSEHVRKNSGFDSVFAPHKSVSLAAEFAPTEA